LIAELKGFLLPWGNNSQGPGIFFKHVFFVLKEQYGGEILNQDGFDDPEGAFFGLYPDRDWVSSSKRGEKST